MSKSTKNEPTVTVTTTPSPTVKRYDEAFLGMSEGATTSQAINRAASKRQFPISLFNFQRIDASEGVATLKVRFSNDLFAADNHEVTIGAAGPQGTPPAGVTVQVVENGTAADAVTVTIPGSYAGPNNRLFGRLQATVP